MSLPPNADLVAVAWVRGIGASGPFDPARVATVLPSGDLAEQALIDGFVQLTVTGGSPDIDVPVRRPVVAVDCWVASAQGAKPPWGKAFALAETVRQATEGDAWRRAVTMPAGYGPVYVLSVMAISEPRRILSDPGRYARVQFDIEIHWRPGA